MDSNWTVKDNVATRPFKSEIVFTWGKSRKEGGKIYQQNTVPFKDYRRIMLVVAGPDDTLFFRQRYGNKWELPKTRCSKFTNESSAKYLFEKLFDAECEPTVIGTFDKVTLMKVTVDEKPFNFELEDNVATGLTWLSVEDAEMRLPLNRFTRSALRQLKRS